MLLSVPWVKREPKVWVQWLKKGNNIWEALGEPYGTIHTRPIEEQYLSEVAVDGGGRSWSFSSGAPVGPKDLYFKITTLCYSFSGCSGKPRCEFWVLHSFPCLGGKSLSFRFIEVSMKPFFNTGNKNRKQQVGAGNLAACKISTTGRWFLPLFIALLRLISEHIWKDTEKLSRMQWRASKKY